MDNPKMIISLQVVIGNKHFSIPVRDKSLWNELDFIRGEMDAKVWLVGTLDIKTEEDYQAFKKSREK